MVKKVHLQPDHVQENLCNILNSYLNFGHIGFLELWSYGDTVVMGMNRLQWLAGTEVVLYS